MIIKIINILKTNIILVLSALAALLLVYFIFNLLGYGFSFTVTKQNIQKYTNTSPVVSFSYDAGVMELDRDTEHHYGPSYLAGVKVKDDPRTACEVRKFDQKLDLSKPVDEAAKQLGKELASSGSGFSSSKSDYITIDGKKAIDMRINFTGPVGDLMYVRQIFIPDGTTTYTLMCGGNKSTVKFYQRHYDRFIDSFRFSK